MTPGESDPIKDPQKDQNQEGPPFPIRYVVYAIIVFVVVFNLGLAFRGCSPA